MVIGTHDISASLGGYREWRPSGPLARYCEAVWHYDGRRAAPPHRLLPDNKPSLILYTRHDALGRVTDSSILVSGSRMQADWYRPAAGDCQTGLRLYPELAAECAGICPRDFRGISEPPPEGMGRHLEPLTDPGAGLPSGAVVAQLVSRFLSQARDVTLRPEHRAAAMIRKSGGRIPVADLARRLDLCERQLRRRFETVMGITPKAYARLIRHLTAVSLADRQAIPDWADIACMAGYFDQSHMIRDIRELTGTSPARLHAERRAESEMSNTVAA